MRNHTITDIMLLKYPELKPVDVSSFRKVCFPLSEPKIKPAPFAEDQLEVVEFFKELNTYSNLQLEHLHQFLLAGKSLDEETSHRFNIPSACLSDDDYDYWCKADLWQLDEFAALLVERQPEILTLGAVYKDGKHVTIGQKFMQYFSLIKRAQETRRFSHRASPVDMLHWAVSKKIGLPEALERSAEKHGLLLDTTDQASVFSGGATDNVLNLSAESEGAAHRQKPPLHTKERESLVKMAIGMAIDGYGYVPSDLRSKFPAELSEILYEQGLPLHKDTIRKFLREGEDILPRDKTISLQENEFPAA